MHAKIGKKNWDGVRGTFKLCYTVIKTFFYETKNAKLHSAIVYILIVLACVSNTAALYFSNQFDSDTTNDELFYLITLFTISELSEVFFSALYDYFLDKLYVVLQVKMTIKAFKNIFEDEGRGYDLSSGRVQYCIREGGIAMAELMRTLLFSIISETINFFLVFIFSWSSIGLNYTIYVFICLVLLIIIHMKVTERKIYYKRKYNTAIANSENSIYESFLNYDTVKASCTEEIEITKLQKKVNKIEYAYVSHAIIENVLFFIEEFLFSVTKSLMMYHFLWKSKKGLNNGKSLRTVILIGKILNDGIRISGKNYKRIVDGIINTKLILDYLHGAVKKDGIYKFDDPFQNKIEFIGVDVYASDRKLLHNVNFCILKGQKVAICSKNSAGKTTMLKALMNMGDFSGTILIDGFNINDVILKDYRKQFFYMPQENTLFNESIIYNLSYNTPDASYKEIVNMCKLIGIHDLIMGMENGYEFNVGERGLALSGGFKQKVLIVRALLKKSPIWILDEPFNNLDMKAQEDLMKILFSDEFKNITALVIVHDDQLKERFDRVVDLSTFIVE